MHDKAFEPTPDLPLDVRDMMQSYYEVRPDYDNWQKPRQVSKLPYPYLSMYSPLQGDDYMNAEDAISAARPENMKTLSFDEKVERLTAVYAEADYLHAFWDGNSRVNRAFMQEMARASGVEFDFAAIDHNTMYVARDKSLAELNLARRPEALKRIRYDYTNAYDGLKETLDNLNRAYPDVSLHQAFAKVAKPIQTQNAAQDKSTNKSLEAESSKPIYPTKEAAEKYLAKLRGEVVKDNTTTQTSKFRPG